MVYHPLSHLCKNVHETVGHNHKNVNTGSKLSTSVGESLESEGRKVFLGSEALFLNHFRGKKRVERSEGMCFVSCCNYRSEKAISGPGLKLQVWKIISKGYRFPTVGRDPGCLGVSTLVRGAQTFYTNSSRDIRWTRHRKQEGRQTRKWRNYQLIAHYKTDKNNHCT